MELEYLNFALRRNEGLHTSTKILLILKANALWILWCSESIFYFMSER